MEYNYSIDLLKNPILLARWESYKQRAKPSELVDFFEVKSNRVHKLYFKTIELENAAKQYFNESEIEEDIKGLFIA